MSALNPDALPLLVEALQAQAELDQLFATFSVMSNHPGPLDEDEREVYEELRAKKAAAVRLRDAALARARAPLAVRAS